jgi:hypothetical protein
MLAGRITESSGQSYAVYLEAQAVPGPSAAATPSSASGPAPAASPANASAPIHLTGSYRGTVTGLLDDRSFSDHVTAAVVQSGRELSGTWTTPSSSGTISGTVLGPTSFTFRLRQETPCAAEFGGLGTIDETGSRLEATYRGGGCRGTSEAGSFIVTRDAR